VIINHTASASSAPSTSRHTSQTPRWWRGGRDPAGPRRAGVCGLNVGEPSRVDAPGCAVPAAVRAEAEGLRDGCSGFGAGLDPEAACSTMRTGRAWERISPSLRPKTLFATGTAGQPRNAWCNARTAVSPCAS
jgi:hypothetical protein